LTKVADSRRCARCGAEQSGGDLSGRCASCLLELALLAPDDQLDADGDDDALMPETAYRVVTILGADDSGTTYLAEQAQTRRLVTLHVVKLQQPFDDERRRVFRERVAGLQRLRHPVIQPVLEARRTKAGDGCVVAVYLNGPQVARYCQSPRVDGASRARLFSLVCEAIAHAHDRGVPHGRLGPEQVIVRRADETSSVPVVVGFSVFPGAPPGLDADLAGLARIARAIGWTGHGPDTWPSIAALREAVCLALGPTTRTGM
jgi:serine/threonine protein kinase